MDIILTKLKKTLLMKLNLSMIVLFISTVACAQTPGQMRYYEYNLENKNLSQLYFFVQTLKAERISEKKIKALEITSKSPQRETYKTIYHFNPSGNIVYSKSKFSTTNFRYIQDTIPTEIVVKFKNKTRRTAFEYDSNYALTAETVYAKGKVNSKRTFELDNGKIVKQTFAEGRNLKKTTVLEKKYNEEGKLIQSTFFKNGKVKNQWDYSCKPEGSDLLASTSNDMGSYCQYAEESADGSYKKYTRTIEKGKPYLSISAFDKDSVFVSHHRYIRDSILVSSSVVQGNATMTSYYKKGKFDYGYRTEQNEAKQTTRQEIYNGKRKKCTSSNVYMHGDNDLIVAHEYFSKGKLQRNSTYEYTYFE